MGLSCAGPLVQSNRSADMEEMNYAFAWIRSASEQHESVMTYTHSGLEDLPRTPGGYDTERPIAASHGKSCLGWQKEENRHTVAAYQRTASVAGCASHYYACHDFHAWDIAHPWSGCLCRPPLMEASNPVLRDSSWQTPQPGRGPEVVWSPPPARDKGPTNLEVGRTVVGVLVDVMEGFWNAAKQEEETVIATLVGGPGEGSARAFDVSECRNRLRPALSATAETVCEATVVDQNLAFDLDRQIVPGCDSVADLDQTSTDRSGLVTGSVSVSVWAIWRAQYHDRDCWTAPLADELGLTERASTWPHDTARWKTLCSASGNPGRCRAFWMADTSRDHHESDLCESLPGRRDVQLGVSEAVGHFCLLCLAGDMGVCHGLPRRLASDPSLVDSPKTSPCTPGRHLRRRGSTWTGGQQ